MESCQPERGLLPVNAMKRDCERGLEVGSDDDLSKPGGSVDLSEAIAQCQNRLAPAASSDDSPVFDLTGTLKGVDGDKSLLRELVAIFLEDTPRLLEEIRKAATERDSRRLSYVAHALKGSISNFSARPAYEAAFLLELLVMDGNIEAAISAADVVTRRTEELMAELSLLLTSAVD